MNNFIVQALKEHKFAKPETLRELCIESYRELKSRAQSTQKSMKLYLSNKDTEYILFKPIRMNIQAAYSQLQVDNTIIFKGGLPSVKLPGLTSEP